MLAAPTQQQLLKQLQLPPPGTLLRHSGRMEASPSSPQSRLSRGPRSNPRPPQYSKGTQDMLRLMMQELKLTTLQRKQINECLKKGAALPLTFDSAASSTNRRPKINKVAPKRLPEKPQRRSEESCRSGNSYVREKFHPGPIRDLEKEKLRLQNIMSTGQEGPTAAPPTNVSGRRDQRVEEEKDRFQEVLDEIEERRQFLADMASLGQEKKYSNIINTEIAQKIRELEMLDQSFRQKKEERVECGEKK
ncbi:UPF0193 protein EVG1 isoform X2 [Nelusetta ayraudi]|uniref:UPF0193 protein EVG1 isoform X2 n=1 Tax=Nelusetta ayraudi TaxID=303726 RepID=UPI003F72C14A